MSHVTLIGLTLALAIIYCLMPIKWPPVLSRAAGRPTTLTASSVTTRVPRVGHALWKLSLLGAAVAGATMFLEAIAQRAEPRFSRVYELAPTEGVYAYARISPSGQFLAYASENPDTSRPTAARRTVRVVDLSSQQVVFQEPGIDAYWSTDGKRMIFLSRKTYPESVSILHHDTGSVTRDVAPPSLGDYFSWGRRNGKDLILTIKSNYYYLHGDIAVSPLGTVEPCPGIGVGDRPLLSKDGAKVTTFVRGTIVVRGLTDCAEVLDTGIQGAKADFSFDGRYIAFHTMKTHSVGYEIQVIDIHRRTIRTVSGLAGSSLFPSWTADGRLSFRYDSNDYRGFLLADNVLTAPERPLPTPSPAPSRLRWVDLFPHAPLPLHRATLVMIWATWSAHSADALRELQDVSHVLERAHSNVGILIAAEPSSISADIRRLLAQYAIRLPQVAITADKLPHTGALNQVPVTLAFRDGLLVARRLGTQSSGDLHAWISDVLSPDVRVPLYPASATRGESRSTQRRREQSRVRTVR